MSADMRDSSKGFLARVTPVLRSSERPRETLGELIPMVVYDHGCRRRAATSRRLSPMAEMNRLGYGGTVAAPDSTILSPRPRQARLAGPSARQAIDELGV